MAKIVVASIHKHRILCCCEFFETSLAGTQKKFYFTYHSSVTTNKSQVKEHGAAVTPQILFRIWKNLCRRKLGKRRTRIIKFFINLKCLVCQNVGIFFKIQEEKCLLFMKVVLNGLIWNIKVL